MPEILPKGKTAQTDLSPCAPAPRCLIKISRVMAQKFSIVILKLIARGYLVDVGVVFESTHNEKGNGRRIAREIDFIVTMGGKKTYIQSAYAMDTEDKIHTETRPFSITGDSFPKIVVRRDIRKRWYNENGILNIGIIDFLLSNDVL